MSTPQPKRKHAVPWDQENEKFRNGEKLEQPLNPRSAFICFTDAKRKEIGSSQSKKEVLRIVAEQWRRLSKQERAIWDEEARNDKVRYVREKAEYKGQWKVPKKRAKKNPLAPKRPMSAFLEYSKSRRASVKKNNPELSNTDVSRLLGEMWRNASPMEKKPYIEQEKLKREAYNVRIKKWREEQSKKDADSRTTHEAVQQGGDQLRIQEPSREHHDAVTFEPFRIQTVEEAVTAVDERMSPHRHPYPAEFLASVARGMDQNIHRRFSYHERHQDDGNRSARGNRHYPLPPFQYHYAPGYAHHLPSSPREPHFPPSTPSTHFSEERNHPYHS